MRRTFDLEVGLLFCCILGGASCRDICAGVDDTCLDLTLEGQGNYDRLLAEWRYPTYEHLGNGVKNGTVADPLSLPARLRIGVPPGPIDLAASTLGIRLTDTQNRIEASGSMELALSSGAHLQASMALPLSFQRYDLAISASSPDHRMGDVTGDGIPDFVVMLEDSLQVLRGDGAGGFAPAFTTSFGSDRYYRMALGDLDQDGVTDVVVVGPFNAKVLVLLSQRDKLVPSNTLMAPSNSNQIALGNFDNNQLLDIAVINPLTATTGTVSIWFGSAGGKVTSPTPIMIPVGANPGAIVAADVNHDGADDLIVLHPSGVISTGGSADVLISNKNGTFQPVKSLSLQGDGLSVAAVDFNSDGNLDLAIASTGAFEQWIGNGQGSFSFQPPLLDMGEVRGQSVVAADLNQDGIVDFVVGDQILQEINVLLGRVDGPPRSFATFSSGFGPNEVNSADFNRDGIPDIAISHGRDSILTVLLGRSP